MTTSALHELSGIASFEDAHSITASTMGIGNGLKWSIFAWSNSTRKRERSITPAFTSISVQVIEQGESGDLEGSTGFLRRIIANGW